MKILRRGHPKPDYPWAGKPWRCLRCRSVIQLDDDDDGYIRGYREDHHNEESAQINCPVCNSWEMFVPAASTRITPPVAGEVIRRD